jgi:hypothetical protein
MVHRPILFALALTASGMAAAAPPAGDPPLPDGGPLHVHMLSGPGPGPGMEHGPAQEVIHTALEIEHLYREEGKPREVIALYQDLLTKAKDPAVRNFAYDALARAEQQPADPERAIATLRQSLDESVQRLNQMPPPRGPEEQGKAPQ